MEKLFFELLQVAVGNKNSLSRMPTVDEWELLYIIATRQALIGVCFVGIQHLNPSETLDLSEALRLRWLGMAVKLQQMNKVSTEACLRVVEKYTHDGIQCCLLKGQGNLVNYPEDLRYARNPGDIDIWCKCADPKGIEMAVSDMDGKGAHFESYVGKRGVIEYALLQARVAGLCKPSIRYNNTELHGADDVEIHHRPSMINNPLYNHRLQRWCEENADTCFCGNRYEGIPVPTNSFNAVYQLCHIYSHLFDEGIGLRQLLDYYFVLKNLPKYMHEEVMHTLGRFGMRRFARAVMWVIARVFADDDDTAHAYDDDNLCLDDWQTRWPWMICEPDEKEGMFLLNEIMQAGNFGKYDVRIKHGGTQWQHAWEKTKHNFRLLSHYPGEVLWEPFFRLYHWIWRKLELWRLGI